MENVKVIVTKEYDVKYCNFCPFCHTKEDTSVCEDSFDDPNFEHYCTHKDADNSGDSREKWNKEGYKYIGTTLSWRGKEPIPKWCPFKKKNK